MLDYLLQVVLFNHCSLILFLIVFPCVCVCICVLCFHLCRHTHVCVYSGSKLISNGGPFCFCFAWFLSYLLSWVSQLNWFSHSSQSTCLRDPLSQFPKYRHYRKVTVPTKHLHKCWGPWLQSSVLCDSMLCNEPSPQPPICFSAYLNHLEEQTLHPKSVYLHNIK